MIITYIEKNQKISSETEYERSILTYKTTKTIHIVDSGRERSIWNKVLDEVTNHNHEYDIEHLISSLNKSINFKDNITKHKYEKILRKTHDAYNRYILESNQNEFNKFTQPFPSSFLQLIRFIPELPEKNLDVYLDERTGCFGVTIKVKSEDRPILSLLMRENKEVIFSFIKRKNKIIKISGRAYFNDHLDDSDEIKNIIRMISL